ncbi:MAG TPA: universal stress protein [Candidatus Angelobacter sp.]|nr:universal stress protein [Candidatus Angelobacter sp.]
MQVLRESSAVSFKSILFLTDFSGASTRALSYALAFARHFQARLYPAHVLDEVLPTSGLAGAEPSVQGLEERARQQLLRQVEYNGIQFQPLLTRCELEVAVPHWVAEHGIDLIIMGTHGRRGLNKFLLGSTSDWVVRNALCPILTVGPQLKVPRQFNLAIDSVFYPAELTGNPGASLKYALSLAEERSARLLLLHMLPEEARNYRDRNRMLRFALDQLQKLLPPDANDRCRPELAVDEGATAERILAHARNERPDLIVMGLRQQDAGGLNLESGVVYQVIASAPCPVLTVPAGPGE